MRAVVRELIETVILALLIFLALQFSVQNFRVEGSSMQPTLEEGQYILVNKLLYLRFDPQDLFRFLPFVDSDRTNFLFPIRGIHVQQFISNLNLILCPQFIQRP